jgi:hypothetical protein
VVEDFCLLPVDGVFSVVEVVAPEPVWVGPLGVDCPAVDPVVVCVDPEVVPGDVVLDVSSFVCVSALDDDEPCFVTVLPEPPEALTVDVGPPEVDVVEPGMAPDAVDVFDSVPDGAVPEVPEVPEDFLPVVIFGPAAFVPESGEPDGWSWPVVADATPWPEATAIPSPTATANPVVRFTCVARFACLPRLPEAMNFLPTPQFAVHRPRSRDTTG